jgi:hypothetical protein
MAGTPDEDAEVTHVDEGDIFPAEPDEVLLKRG